MVRVLFFSIFLLTPLLVGAQSVNVELTEDNLHKAERLRILNSVLDNDFHPSFKPYQRSVLISYLEQLDTLEYSDVEKFNLDYLIRDSWEYSNSEPEVSKKPIFKHFYKVPSDAFHVREESFDLHVNPVIYFMGGRDSSDEDNLFINTRGLELRGMIDQKVGFYSFVGENQMSLPTYADQYTSASSLPGIGFFKRYNGLSYDYFTLRGYISFQATQHINMQFGYDRHKIGMGMRSLLLSNFAPPQLFFKIQTKIWKFNYTNLYTQLTSERKINPSTGSYPLKYMTLHHLSLNLGKKVNLGLFETVVHGGPEQGGYDIKYINPIIFYRAVEHQTGSADNVLVGMELEWLVTKGISLYSQFVLDEFLLSELKNGDGWWANKYGLQVGINYINAFGINTLDMKMEWNGVRPYTYAHNTSFGSYSHFEETLAHPWGANFHESLFEIRYQPINRLELSSRTIVGTRGLDDATSNWGSDILKDYALKEQEYGNFTTQGIETNIFFTRFKASYMVRHNVFIDGKYIFRNESSSQVSDGKSHIFGLALRMNISDQQLEF